MVDFEEFIARQIEQNPIEARIVRKIVKALKDAGNPVVSVFGGDEEEVAVKNQTEVLREVFNLDTAYLNTKNGGWVFFVGGNDWDCLSDYSLSLEEALQPVLDYIEKFGE